MRAAEGGRSALYELAYCEQCNASHSGLGTLEYALVPDADGLGVYFGPQAPSARPIALAITALCWLLGDVADAAGLLDTIGARVMAIAPRVNALFDLDREARSSSAQPAL